MYQKENYREAMMYFERSAKLGDAQSLERIGDCYYKDGSIRNHYIYAIRFYEAAAYRGSLAAKQKLANQFNAFGTCGWKQYAQMANVAKCENVFYGVSKEAQNKDYNILNLWNGQDGMMHGAVCWNNYLRNPGYQRRNSMDVPIYSPQGGGKDEAERSFEIATFYGNVDAYCAQAMVKLKRMQDRWYDPCTSPKDSAIADYKIAVFMGHPHAMYMLGQHYDSIDIKTANACYVQAAKWNYLPALKKCGTRGVVVAQ